MQEMIIYFDKVDFFRNERKRAGKIPYPHDPSFDSKLKKNHASIESRREIKRRHTP